MRQTSQTDKTEDAMRTCLEHMRYRDCTDEDIAFLRSRIPSYNRSINIGDPSCRDVSVITAWNTHKDQINDMNAERFARERQVPLHTFYSIDKQGLGRGKVQQKSTARASDPTVKLTPAVQEALWRSPPYTSKHIPARLQLCVGMPVMIRNNEATELGITKGQEATVVGWTSREIPGFPGRSALEVLFVKLSNPKSNIKLPYLEENVVPLTRLSTAVRAILPNDAAINISRQQIPVLLNFAMTDYTSQGKTREVNVIDLYRSRNHQAMYTALSRGTSAASTVILRDFDETKLKGGASGYLRQEYRTIDTLDEITKARYERTIPPSVVQRLRASTILSYKSWLRKQQSEDSTMPTATSQKRQADDMPLSDMRPTKKAKLDQTVSPLGLDVNNSTPVNWKISWKWDSVDWSCAYDSFLSVLRHIWYKRDGSYIAQSSKQSWYMDLLFRGFAMVHSRDTTLDICRLDLRSRLWPLDAEAFPRGQTGTDLFSLVRLIIGASVHEDESVTHRLCLGCHSRTPGAIFEGIGPYTVMMSTLSREVSVGKYLKALENVAGRCTDCGGELLIENEYPMVMAVQLPNLPYQTLKRRLVVSTDVVLENCGYRIAGVVYWGAHHFAARLVTDDLQVFRYDGMDNDGMVSEESTNLRVSANRHSLSVMDDKVASLAVYIRV
ncbi:hypothetical protein DFP72DRAFT_821214 [Ephemerocybe angulata]|uniref:DNA helicase n=1 Tax=Ephemerocybe angulata TaxID=980116 RepID=A0A8H6HK19_9AGAR|nr:hypothetical protein DFP72DRAFT_821214 [Tulosesus angulatus]